MEEKTTLWDKVFAVTFLLLIVAFVLSLVSAFFVKNATISMMIALGSIYSMIFLAMVNMLASKKSPV